MTYNHLANSRRGISDRSASNGARFARPSLWQQWRAVIGQFRTRDLVIGSSLVLAVFGVGALLFIAVTGG